MLYLNTHIEWDGDFKPKIKKITFGMLYTALYCDIVSPDEVR